MVVARSTHATYCLPLAPIYKDILTTIKPPSSVSMILQNPTQNSLNGVGALHLGEEQSPPSERSAFSSVRTLDNVSSSDSETTISDVSSDEDEGEATNYPRSIPTQDPRIITSSDHNASAQVMCSSDSSREDLGTTESQRMDELESVDSLSAIENVDIPVRRRNVGVHMDLHQEVGYQNMNRPVHQSSDDDEYTCLPTNLVHERVLSDLGHNFQEDVSPISSDK